MKITVKAVVNDGTSVQLLCEQAGEVVYKDLPLGIMRVTTDDKFNNNIHAEPFDELQSSS